MSRRVSKGLKDFKHTYKKQSIFQYVLYQFVVLMTSGRQKTAMCIQACMGLALLSQNYWCHLTSILYKPDTSLRRTVGVGPNGVLLTVLMISLYRVVKYICAVPNMT